MTAEVPLLNHPPLDYKLQEKGKANPEARLKRPPYTIPTALVGYRTNKKFGEVILRKSVSVTGRRFWIGGAQSCIAV